MATDSQNRTVPGIGLPPEVVEDILSAPRRRALLSCLAESGEMVVDDLAACVCARERDTHPEDVSGTDRQEYCVELYDKHLPKLTATGIVRYDSMRECVELAAPAIADRLDEYPAK